MPSKLQSKWQGENDTVNGIEEIRRESWVWGLMKSDLGLVQLKCQQNSHMKVLNRPLVKEDYSLAERLFLPGRLRNHLQRGGTGSCESRCICHSKRWSREMVPGIKRF